MTPTSIWLAACVALAVLTLLGVAIISLYIGRVLDQIRLLRADMQLMGRCMDHLADTQRRALWITEHPESARRQLAA
jgi:hypothetical protein